MEKADIIVEVNFDLKNPEKTVIKTNAKKEAVKGILETFLHSQIGRGKDTKESNKKDKYKIVIKLDLSDDTFYTTSDTGNEGLTCGVIMYVLSKMSQITIIDLE